LYGTQNGLTYFGSKSEEIEAMMINKANGIKVSKVNTLELLPTEPAPNILMPKH